MKTCILCCGSLEKEVRLAMNRRQISYPLEILTDNNHDSPRRLSASIQNKLDQMDAQRVLMAFGTCGGAMVGLRSGNLTLVIPRVDDCLSLLMGSMEQRYALSGGFGLFLTDSWMNHEKSIESELGRIRSRYPPERADKVISALYGHFRSLNVIDTGAYDVASLLPRSRVLARQLELEHRVVRGTTAYLEALLQGPWESDRFIVIPPNAVISDADCMMHPHAPDSVSLV